jgi:four helix bundle protein
MKPKADDSEIQLDSDDTSHAHAPRPTPDPHAHAHAPESATPGVFPHDKLDAYRISCELAALANKIAAHIPRGHRNIADHLLRSASNTVLLLAEGANRRGAASKRQRFAESRGECAEVAAAGDLLLAMDIGPRHDVEKLKGLASRVSAMLTGLIERLR